MNQVFVCAQAAEDAKEVYVDSSRTIVKVKVQLPPTSNNKAATEMYYHIWKDTTRWLQHIKAGTCLYIHGAQLHHDLEAREHSLHGGNPAIVNESFPIYNTVLLTGRVAKDIDQNDQRAFKVTDQYMIANTSITVSKGKMQADLFNITAINKFNDAFKPAELLANMTRKGTGITIRGQLSTDTWFDNNKKEQQYRTKIVMQQMTLAPKTDSAASTIKPTNTIAADSAPKSLWGGRTADSVMPESPHQAAIAMPQSTEEAVAIKEPEAPTAIAEPWGDNTNGLPPLPNDNDPF